MNETVALLCQMIRYPSLSGAEGDLLDFLQGAFAAVTDEAVLTPLPDDLPDDPDYCTPIPGLSPAGRHNLVARVRGTGGGRSLIFNTHTDVVPAPENWRTAFQPEVTGDFVRGRGACDAKGQIAILWAALRRLKASGARLRGDVIIHIVVEEENGGNGTLALIRDGLPPAAGVVVLEPSDLRLVTATRGAIWFRAACAGRPGHVGNLQARNTEGSLQNNSALKTAVALMNVFEAYHAELLAASRGIPLFDAYENPMPLLFGRLAAGVWPATVPDSAVLEGVLGFLPNRTKEQVMAGLRAAVQAAAANAGGMPNACMAACNLEFTFRHDGFVTAADAPVAAAMAQAIAGCGGAAEPIAMPASSDAWLYNNRRGIPTVTFGVGKLTEAHSDHEQVAVADLERGAAMLYDFIRLFAG